MDIIQKLKEVIRMARKVVDNTNYSFENATDAFVVYADYDTETDQFINPSATPQEIYAEMHTNKRPCVLVAENGNRTIAAACYTSRNTSAIFFHLDGGKVYSYLYYNGEIKLQISTDDVLPLIVTADYVPSSGAISNLSATAQEIVIAVAGKRPCFLFAKSDLLTTFIAQCDYATFENGSYKAEFSRVTDEGAESWVINGTTITHYSDFTQGIFSAENGVSASEAFYRKGMVFAMRFTANGTFTSGKKTLGTYSGIDIDANGIVGACAIRTGNNGANFDANGTFTLAEDGELSVYYNGAYTGVAINLSYIWPL